MQEKSCATCSGKYNGCHFIHKFKKEMDMDYEMQCALENADLNIVIDESLNLEPLFQQMQDAGIIKKSQDVHNLANDIDIRTTLNEAITDAIWSFMVRTAKDVGRNISAKCDMEYNSDCFCSEWK